MKNKLRILVTLLFFFFATQSFSTTISKINFIGLNNSSQESLLKIIPFQSGQEYTNALSDGIIESLFETGLFSDIGIEINESSLNIKLKENPIIRNFEFDHIKDKGMSNWLKAQKLIFSDDALNDELKSRDLVAGNTLSDKKLEDFVAYLQNKYIESGYYNAEISKNVSVDSLNRASIVLSINQGNQVKINSLTITGAEKLSEASLLKLFKVGEADMLLVNLFTKKDLFTDEEFSQGIDAMTYEYFNAGYLDFKILNIDTMLSEFKETISIDIEISEGIQYKLGKVLFSGDLGNTSISTLENQITLNEGDVFNRESIINDIQKLTDIFADQGYAFVNINPIISELIDTVSINFEISLNKKVYINRIEISGNTRTQDEVIRREIGVSEGGLYSRSDLKSALLSLRRLGYFSDVQISTSEVEGSQDKLDIKFLVEETQTGSVSFSVSHSNNYGISFGAGIQEKNIFGSGNTLNADFKISESYNKLSLYFMNPNYNDEGHSISVGAFKSEINDDDVAENSYEINSTGITFGYGIPLRNSTRVNTDFVYSKNEVKCSSLFSGASYESSQCSTNKKDEFKFNLSWTQNTLNDYLYPTQGINNSISAGIALPPGDYKYYNFGADHLSYRPLSANTTLKLTGNFNLSKGYNNEPLPFYKRNFGGGSGSVRGFGNKSLGPQYPNGKAKGGEISILGSANLIAPAFFIDNNDKMRVSAFIDTGNIYAKSSNIKLGDIRMSTGLGFAYLSPIGSIGAFISTPILKKDGDVIEDFGFSLGTGF